MKKIIILSLLLIIIPSISQAENKDWKIDCCQKGTIFINRTPIDACHVVESGETLWSLAKKYYGNGFAWKKLQYYTEYMRPNVYPKDPRKLAIGSKLVVWRAWEVGGAKNEEAGWGIDYKNGDIYTTGSESDSKKFIYKNNEPYAGPFRYIQYFTIDSITNNKVYVVSDRERYDNPVCFTNSMITPGKQNPEVSFRFYFNKEVNEYESCGQDFKLLTFSPDGKYYAIRNNTDQDANEMKFIVLSNFGNGPIYDYSDSLIWYNNDTLVYRAQNNDEWRVVVNNKDYKIYNYLENLRVENGVIKFNARHDDGSWSKEEFTL